MRGEVVLLAGGSGGIGRATARRFAREGARVVLLGRDEERLRAAEREAGHGAWSLRADLTEPGAAARVAAEVEAREGRLDTLVNGAGELRVGPAEELGHRSATELVQVNYLAAVRLVHACLPLLRRSSRRSIVNVSSIAGPISPPFMAAYAASKAALEAYCRSLRQELAPDDIQVALVVPGPVRTAMVDGKLGTPHYPLPRGVPVASADQVAEAIFRVVSRRRRERTVPRRLAGVCRLAGALPSLVDAFYRRYVRRARHAFPGPRDGPHGAEGTEACPAVEAGGPVDGAAAGREERGATEGRPG